ncbi:MAG: hypothetical protein WC869_04555 [Phycisphaerae bacterium]|jgi:type II secretory pathway pseudopilin PulG
MKPKRTAAYTAVEILLIVLLFLLVGIIVTPGAVSAYDSLRNDRLQKDLQYLRTQIEQYRTDHGGMGPHLNENGEVDVENMVARMTRATFSSGRLSRYGACGPYIPEWPSNPFCKSVVSQAIKFGTTSRPPRDDSSGWYYNIDTCMVSPNSTKGSLAGSIKGDPFIRITGGDTVHKDDKTAAFRLKGILRGPEGSEVIINGQRLHEGDSIDDGVIRRIDAHAVELEVGGHHLTIEMPRPLPSDDDEPEPTEVLPAPATPGR